MGYINSLDPPILLSYLNNLSNTLKKKKICRRNIFLVERKKKKKNICIEILPRKWRRPHRCGIMLICLFSIVIRYEWQKQSHMGYSSASLLWRKTDEVNKLIRKLKIRYKYKTLQKSRLRIIHLNRWRIFVRNNNKTTRERHYDKKCESVCACVCGKEKGRVRSDRNVNRLGFTTSGQCFRRLLIMSSLVSRLLYYFFLIY